MKRRTIPFGYRYENGAIMINSSSSDIVKEIFSRYLSGDSMLNIAQLLNKMHIEYRPGVVGWNKARIKRILEDKRYAGDDDYPQIISDETLKKADALRDAKNNQKNVNKTDDIYNLNAETICPCCGSVMKRRYEPRTKIHERWICQNGDCRKTVVKTDDSLLGEIGELINQLIDNPEMVRCINSDETINLESYRIENEIRHMIDGRQLNKSEIRRKLIEATAIHYANLDTKKYEIQRLKCILKNQNRPNGFPLELFNLAAETISFDEDDQIVLKLINGQIIRKEHAYAAS